jgi:hypothetical protein
MEDAAGIHLESVRVVVEFIGTRFMRAEQQNTGGSTLMYMAKTDGWYLERIIWLVAGTFSLGSAVLAWLHSPLWLILTALVGINLIIFGLTGFCIMANILYKLGAKPRLGCGVEATSEAPSAHAQ